MVDRFAQVRTLIGGAQRRHRRVGEMMKGASVPYYRRGEMSIPAFRLPKGSTDPAREGRTNSLRLMKKASELPVDFFFYDLEDAAPDRPEYKPLARRFVIEAFERFDFGDRVCAFRPNNIRTEYFENDIVDVVGAVGDALDAVIIPKTETADEVRDIQKIVRQIQRIAGRHNRISLEVLIESPRGFMQAEEIAAVEDVTALVFGSWDFARTTGGQVDAQTWLSDQAAVRQLLPVIAAAHGKDAVDAVTATLPLRGADDDPHAPKARMEALALARRDAADARRLGFAAKWILHPDQIEPIHAAWTPSPEAAKRALTLAADYARAAAAGSGAHVFGGAQMADKAVVATEWWLVRAALHAGVLSEADIARTGFTILQLERTVRTRD